MSLRRLWRLQRCVRCPARPSGPKAAQNFEPFRAPSHKPAEPHSGPNPVSSTLLIATRRVSSTLTRPGAKPRPIHPVARQQPRVSNSFERCVSVLEAENPYSGDCGLRAACNFQLQNTCTPEAACNVFRGRAQARFCHPKQQGDLREDLHPTLPCMANDSHWRLLQL